MKRREAGPDQEAALWRGAKRVRVGRPTRAMTSLLSVRMPREVFRALSTTARRQGKGPTTLARELIEHGLVQEPAASAALVFRVLARLLESRPEAWPPSEKLLPAGRASRSPGEK